jgi:hypothetical protein
MQERDPQIYAGSFWPLDTLTFPLSFLCSCFPDSLVQFFSSPSESKRPPPFRRANDRRCSANESLRRILV